MKTYTTDNDKMMGCLALAISIPISLILGTLWKAYILSLLWKWYLVHKFALPEIGVVQAVGISLVASLLTYQTHDCARDKREISETIGVMLSSAFLAPLFVLFIGWFVKGWL